MEGHFLSIVCADGGLDDERCAKLVAPRGQLDGAAARRGCHAQGLIDGGRAVTAGRWNHNRAGRQLWCEWLRRSRGHRGRGARRWAHRGRTRCGAPRAAGGRQGRRRWLGRQRRGGAPNTPFINHTPRPCALAGDCVLPALRIHPSINLVYHFLPDWELRGELFGVTADISSPVADPRISFSLSSAWRFH